MGRSILAIDPASKCGWALFCAGQILSGTWKLNEGRFAGGGMRYVRFRALLNEVKPLPQLVVFEEVRRHLGVDAAHIYGGLIATLTAWCEENRLPYQGIPVGSIKAHATGKGNANKDAMMAAAKAKWPTFAGDDNEADALWILDLARKEYGK